VSATAPTRTGGPSVAGKATVGSTLSCSATYSGATAITYGWLRDGAAIAGAHARTYKASGADYLRNLSCSSAGTNAAGSSGTATSAARHIAKGAAVKSTAKPKVGGTAKVGKKLTATKGKWAAPISSYSYQWLRDGKKIAKATKATYKAKAKDRGHKLKVKVSAKSRGYATGTATSKATAKVKPKH